jgi:hypothetical protein
VAAAGFLALMLLARGSHPGNAASPASSGSSNGSSVTSQQDDGFSLDSGSLTQSSGSTPPAQTSVS